MHGLINCSVSKCFFIRQEYKFTQGMVEKIYKNNSTNLVYSSSSSFNSLLFRIIIVTLTLDRDHRNSTQLELLPSMRSVFILFIGQIQHFNHFVGQHKVLNNLFNLSPT